MRMRHKIFNKFMDLDKPYSELENAKFVVIPAPYEATTTYGKGTKNGPSAIMQASQYLEFYDHELDKEVYKVGINTHRTLALNTRDYQNRIFESTEKVLKDNKIPVIIGGEHSISFPAVMACKKKYKDLSVLQFDAHSDLRNEYNGSKFNHGCVMRRIIEVCPAVQVGIRAMDKEERDFAQRTGQWNKIHFAEKLELVENVITQLSDEVYITFDVDVLDPSIMPSTGTPEPGGLDYYEVLDIVKGVAHKKKIVGFDIVELAPIKGLNYPDFTIAKIIYKLIGYISNRA